MTSIPLRAYTREIEGLVEHEQRLDEAIAHCRQILKTYPKHLETYRLLGKAYLEGKRYDEAVDVFERLLVAVPDDFVAHVGMSIIADDQGKLDDAIWHMERAFEVQPSNAAIQGELQRLFGRRDGAEPPKIRLTRGALAHMYVQGQLYTQAISEIRAVLGQDSERTDLRVLLAKACFYGGQKTEAADVCAELLSRYPYCFDANALMVELLTGMGKTESAGEYRQRVNELDPYTAFTHDSVFSTASVPDNAVNIERLDYVGQAPPLGPLLGSTLESTVEAPPSAWPPPVALDRHVEDIPPFLRAASVEDIPPFLRASRDQAVGTGAYETNGVGPTEEEQLPETPPADLPAWVRALAPTDDEAPPAGSGAELPEIPAWLRSHDAEASGTADTIADGTQEPETPAWLKDLGAEVEQPVEEAGVFEPQPTASHEESSPTPEISSLDTTPQEPDDGLAWLESLAAKPGATPDELMSSAEAPSETPPAWVDKAAGITQPAAAAGTASAADSSGQPPPTGDETAETTAVSSGFEEPAALGSEQPESSAEMPPADWLHSLAEQSTYVDLNEASEEDVGPGPAEGSISDWPRVVPPPAIGEEPPWLSSPASEANPAGAPISAAGSGESESEAVLPDWLSELDTEKSSLAEPPTPAVPQPWVQGEAKATPPTTVGEGAGDWGSAESGPHPEATPESQVAPSVAEPPEVPGMLPLGIPAQADAGPLPRGAKPAAGLLDSAQTELGRGNIAAALDAYGKLIHKGKSLTDIIRDLRDALYRYPVEVPIWQTLGDAYMRANRLQEALDAYTKAEELLR